MKITRVETILLSYPMGEEMRDSRLAFSRRSSLLIKVETDAGIHGWGESACYGGPLRSTAAVIQEELAPYLIGEDPLFPERHWDRIYQGTIMRGRRGLIIAAMSGLDIALWDILGKACGRPLYQIMGGFCDRMRAYASAGFYTDSKGRRELAGEMASYVEEGYTAVKMKIGGLSMQEDLERIRAVRESIGPEIELMVDANCAYSPKQAMAMAQRMEDLNIAWFEEPVPTDNVEGSARLAAFTSIPIAGNESEFSRFGFRDLIVASAVDIVQPDCIWTGGISECRRIAAIASAFGLPCVPHSFSSAVALVANMHLIASIPNGYLLEMDRNPNPLREELISEPIRIDGKSWVAMPQGPGLGIELNEDVLQKYRVER
ncbi:MAG: mandelate racemase/muconate lactonizing enzyme family protein [bacterium]|jgi:L-alanine-DL-glutamate epimerase-like enolase superfamily enzyme